MLKWKSLLKRMVVAWIDFYFEREKCKQTPTNEKKKRQWDKSCTCLHLKDWNQSDWNVCDVCSVNKTHRIFTRCATILRFRIFCLVVRYWRLFEHETANTTLVNAFYLFFQLLMSNEIDKSNIVFIWTS